MFFHKPYRLRDNMEKFVQPARSQMTIWRMRVACRVCKATNTYSEYVILIVFTLQQWLHERASVLYLYLHCLSCIFHIMSA